MISQDIRRKFLKYFEQSQHTIVPSSPVLPHDDPTLLFINAGMNQFKDVFLGGTKRDYTRATTSQKCVRVGGKHNDLENVGHTKRHLTFFEMLGNFSFGDYFKEKAIKFSWEVSTEVFELDPTRIWPTVFKDDDEAFDIWTNYVPADRITRFGEKQNFWAMGDTGPCGPCSELLYDRGPDFGSAQNPTEDIAEERYMEFWNLVFMQYNKDQDGKVRPLPKPSIDTGAGLERVVSLKLDVDNVYETDILRGIIARVEELTGIPYRTEDTEKAPAFRVIADHLRCLAIAIADGVQPSNIERGYVLRKVLRRAVRYGRTLGLDKPFLGEVLPTLITSMGDDYPELKKGQTRIEEILSSEEEAFQRTLRRGGNILNQIIDDARNHGKEISGQEAFKLKDTYGFPLEEILLLAKDAELAVDTKEYEKLEVEAKERSRSVHKTTQQMASENLFANYVEEYGPCDFVGYKDHEANGSIIAIVVDDEFVNELHSGQEGVIVLNKTPFYAEMGGQVGDTGIFMGQSSHFEVTNTTSPYKGVITHSGKVISGTLRIDDSITATVDRDRRQKIANNHTATHLLHWGLCQVLGEHVKQAGSVVDPSRLRFDFSHHKALTKEELNQIEDLVNEKIRCNNTVDAYELPFAEAQKRDDIKQFFGDKYDQTVRVVDIDFSKELCGGTHTSAIGTIGLFRIAKEGSIAAGVRRIEAVTGAEAEELNRDNEELIGQVAELLKTSPNKLVAKAKKLLEENKALALQLKEMEKQNLGALIEDILTKIEEVNGIRLLAAELTLPADQVRDFADEAMTRLSSGVLILGTKSDGRCQLIARVSDDLINKGFNANEIIKTLAPIINGGGGGKANAAQAGGKAPEKISAALREARELFNK